MSDRWLTLAQVRRWEPEARRRGVSQVARSGRGFLAAYKRAGSSQRMSPEWVNKRHGFIARHMAQVANGGEKLWEKVRGRWRPTRRHLALIMWAFSPQLRPPRFNPEEDEDGEPTVEDELAEDRIRDRIARRISAIGAKGKRATPQEQEELRQLRAVTDDEVRQHARVRCSYCGSDPRDPEQAGIDVVGRQLVYAGCCPAGREEVEHYLADLDAQGRVEWAQAIFGPWVQHYGQIANVSRPDSLVDKRRRGAWELEVLEGQLPAETHAYETARERAERAEPWSVGYELQARVVRSMEWLRFVGDFVVQHHAHLPKYPGKSWKFGVVVWNGPDVVGVAWVMIPGSREFPVDGSMLDVSRVAIRRDLPAWLRANAASLIYSTAWEAARTGTWVSDEEWKEIREGSGKKRDRATTVAEEVVSFSADPNPELLRRWGAALGVAPQKRTWDAVQKKARFTLANQWRVARQAVRMITYTLAEEETGRTLIASGWEPARWSPPHKRGTGERADRENMKADAPKIRWQIGLPQDARPILRLLGPASPHEDLVTVGRSRSGRPDGTVRTVALRVLGVPAGSPRAVTWETTLEEAAATPVGVRKRLNPCEVSR